MRQTATIIIIGLLIVLSGCVRTLSDAEIAAMSLPELMQQLQQDRFFSDFSSTYPNDRAVVEELITRATADGMIDESTAERLRAGEIWTGMRNFELLIACGPPRRRTTGPISQSWHYGYFPHMYASVYLRRDEPGGPLVVRNWSISR